MVWVEILDRIAWEVLTEKVSLEQSTKGSKSVNSGYLGKNIPGRGNRTFPEIGEWLMCSGNKESSMNEQAKEKLAEEVEKKHESVHVSHVKTLALTQMKSHWRVLWEEWHDLTYSSKITFAVVLRID